MYNSGCLWVTIRCGAHWVNNSLLSSWNHMILLSVKFLKMSSLSSKRNAIWIALTGYMINRLHYSQGISVRNQCFGCVSNLHWCYILWYSKPALKEAQTENRNMREFPIRMDLEWRGSSFKWEHSRAVVGRAKTTAAVENNMATVCKFIHHTGSNISEIIIVLMFMGALLERAKRWGG